MKFYKQTISSLLGIIYGMVRIGAIPLTSNNTLEPLPENIKNAKRILNPSNKFSGHKASLNSALPEKFDLRNVDGLNFVSPIKDQGYWGTCWAFGSMAASEVSAQYELYKSYGITPQEMPLDFSELQIAWFGYSHLQINDTYYPSQRGEGSYYDTDKEVLNEGGFNNIAISLMSSGIGPLDEKDIPYSNKSGNVYWYQVDENGNYQFDEEGYLIGEVQPLDWDAPENFVPVGYSIDQEEDWSVNKDKKFKSKLRLQHANKLPCPAIYDEDGNFHHDREGIKAIKKEIIKGHAVEIAFKVDDGVAGDEYNPPKYLSENYSHYTFKKEIPDHIVCIVGYDDNYSKENFIVAPPKDGAFIVKNSWGGLENKFKSDWGIDGTGYFYLSYYDMSISDPTSYDFKVSDITKENVIRTINQHDLVPAIQGWEVYGGNMTYFAMANVFKTEYREKLDSISSYVFVPDTTVEYEIYILNENYKDPTDGKLVASDSKKFKYAGFHLISLTKSVLIPHSSSYSIVIKQKDKSNNYYYGFSAGFSKSFYDAYNNEVIKDEYKFKYYIDAVVNEGESFIYSGIVDGWVDQTKIIPYFTDYEDEDTKISDYWQKHLGKSSFKVKNGLSIDNFPIKGYARLSHKLKPNNN